MTMWLSAEQVLEDLLERYSQGTSGQANSLCPFPDHDDTTPSFRINVDRGSPRYLLWKCNGCGKRGNGWRLLRTLLGEGSEGLVESLLPKLQSRRVDFARQKSELEPALPEPLLSVYSDFALPRLLASGFTQETLDLHEVGWDEQRQSYTYPIRDYLGRLVGMYRRRTEGEGPKYLPYEPKHFPEGLVPADYVFRKGHHLWCLNQELAAPTKRKVVVVEGMKARMWVQQHFGDQVHVVATMGTSISPWQMQQLSFLSGPFTIFYDNAYRALALGRDVSRQLRDAGCPARAVKVYSEDPKAQPDDLTPDEIERILRL